jgi:hypothetical protein
MPINKSLAGSASLSRRFLFRASMNVPTLSKRQFAPLNPELGVKNAPLLKGIVFDVDGTLCMLKTCIISIKSHGQVDEQENQRVDN